MIQYIGGGGTSSNKLQDIVFEAKKNGDYAKEQGDRAKEVAENIEEAAENASEAVEKANEAIEHASEAANNADEKANLAQEKAELAQEKIDSLDTLETEINQSIADSQTATQNANTSATNANDKANYAQQQGDYAKAQGDYAKAQGEAIQGMLDNGSVISVNGKTGEVILTAEDIGAVTEDQIHKHENKDVLDSLSDVNGQLNYKDQPVGSVVSVNGKTGEVTLSASDIGAETLEGSQAKADQAEQNSKTYTDQRLANLNLSDNEIVKALQKEIANLNLQLQASQRVPNGHTFGTDFYNEFGMSVDYTRTAAIGALETNTTDITVQDTTGFKVGQEVTIYDDVNLERVTIQAIDVANRKLTVSALTKSYKDRASIARTMAMADSVNNCLKFGGWSTQAITTILDKTVIDQAYDTSGNGGRKLVRLSNGEIVVAVKYDKGFYIYKSIDGFQTDKRVILSQEVTSITDIALETDGVNVFVVFSYNGNSVKAFTIDANNNDIGWVLVENANQSAVGNISIAINSTKTGGCMAYSSKNSTYPYSFNIRAVQFTINVDGTTTWGAVSQLTSSNTAGTDHKNPTVVIRNDGKPLVIWDYNSISGGGNIIYAKYYDGASWSSYINVYINNGFTQSSPSACISPNGRIWVTWHGKVGTDTTHYNICVSCSDDGGLTWSTMQRLTSGNTYDQINPSITVNKRNEAFVIWQGTDSSDAYSDILVTRYSDNGWEGIYIIANGTTGHKQNPSVMYDPSVDASVPLFIYQDLQGNKVGLFGSYMMETIAPLLENDIRFTVQDTSEIVAWVVRDEFAGFTIDAQLNGQNMEKSSINGEDQFIGALQNAQPVEIKLHMTRNSTSDDVKISKILGGVS